jgi:hypothetical protein
MLSGSLVAYLQQKRGFTPADAEALHLDFVSNVAGASDEMTLRHILSIDFAPCSQRRGDILRTAASYEIATKRREAAGHHLPSQSHKSKTITIKIPIWSMVFMETPPA